MSEQIPELLGIIRATPKTGKERFHFSGKKSNFNLLGFWRWSVSDLVSNATRGRLAEFIVAHALGADNDVRSEWDAFDLTTPDGIKVEVKSAAYVQSWFQRSLSSITFLYRKTLRWDAQTNIQLTERGRWADVYVFALLDHPTKATIDPLDLDQWEFYVVPTESLDARTRSQHSIGIRSLRASIRPTKYAGLAKAVTEAKANEPPCRIP